MSTNLPLFHSALDECHRLRASDLSSRILLSIQRQLEYLIELEEGTRTDTALIANLNLGQTTFRELEPMGHHKLSGHLLEVTAAVREKWGAPWNTQK